MPLKISLPIPATLFGRTLFATILGATGATGATGTTTGAAAITALGAAAGMTLGAAAGMTIASMLSSVDSDDDGGGDAIRRRPKK